MSAIVEIFEIMNYVNEGSRPFEEGCKIVHSKHILICGESEVVNKSTKTTNNFALCLQTSLLTSYPREIGIEITRLIKETKMIAHCTCKAGNSGKCKLLLLNRNTSEPAEKLGCTDMRQQWGQISQRVSAVYPFRLFYRDTQVKSNYEIKTPELKQEIFKILCSKDDSELSQHTKMYRSSALQDYYSRVPPRVLKKLCENPKAVYNNVPVICDLNAL